MTSARTGRPARRSFAVVAAAGTLLALAPLSPSSAAPPTGRIVAVFDADDCPADGCRPGQDKQLKSGATRGGAVEVHVEADSTYGLNWIQLEAHLDGTPAARWYCVQEWDISATQGNVVAFSGSFRWNTVSWPNPPEESQCSDGRNSPHFHGADAKNGAYTLRVTAKQRPPEDTPGSSAGFDLRIVNAPVAPTWAAAPSASGGSDPRVTLRWQPNPEEKTRPAPDIVEYHFVRIDPSGDAAEFAVGAAAPERQGCARLGSIYQCTDPNLPRSGTYQYALLAFRDGAGKGKPCRTTNGTCVESPLSSVHEIDIRVSAPAPAGPTDPEDRQSLEPDPDASVLGERSSSAPVVVETDDDRDDQVAAALSNEEDAKPVAVPVALGLVLVLLALHLRRFLRGA